jgi:hypothetical protein
MDPVPETGDVPNSASAKGLPEARERLRIDRLNRTEQSACHAHIEALQYQKSVIQTSLIEGRTEGLVEGTAETLEKIILTNSKAGFPVEAIAKITGYTANKISDVLKQHMEPSE